MSYDLMAISSIHGQEYDTSFQIAFIVTKNLIYNFKV